jgi:hypothetical protein
LCFARPYEGLYLVSDGLGWRHGFKAKIRAIYTGPRVAEGDISFSRGICILGWGVLLELHTKTDGRIKANYLRGSGIYTWLKIEGTQRVYIEHSC